MQSGNRNTKRWLLEIEPAENSRFVEPIMGWTGTEDNTQQVRIFFSTSEDAVKYAKEQGLEYTFIAPKPKKYKPKSYSDNFKFKNSEDAA